MCILVETIWYLPIGQVWCSIYINLLKRNILELYKNPIHLFLLGFSKQAGLFGVPGTTLVVNEFFKLTEKCKPKTVNVQHAIICYYLCILTLRYSSQKKQKTFVIFLTVSKYFYKL